MIPTGVIAYVVAALVFVVSCVSSYALGWHQKGVQAEAQIAAIKADLGERLAKAQARAAEVRERVVIEYRDRIIKVREVSPEVVHEIQVVRDSGCVLPPEWLRLHDAATGLPSEAAAGANESAEGIDCATAIETVRENYARARENAEQLRALQEWAAQSGS